MTVRLRLGSARVRRGSRPGRQDCELQPSTPSRSDGLLSRRVRFRLFRREASHSIGWLRVLGDLRRKRLGDCL